MKNSDSQHYNLVTRSIHWISALVVIAMFAVGTWMMALSYYSEWYRTAPHWHKSVGLLLAGLTLFRLIWKALSSSPKIEGERWEIVAAKSAHHLMYVGLFVLFVSGYLISTEDGRGIEVFNWFTVPGAGALFENQADIAGNIHFYTAWGLIILAGLHAVAALKHHFINRDNTLRKMLTGASK
ncbi:MULTISPECIES: cytochrome b [Vibrio]|uniref:cytochrome b n=1 Tax=Vibrio TaxID=662 RepID=UPI000892FB7C|nr:MULTISPECIES: cytochrome b [Vibrio]OFJ28133.1 cytochrome b [Vibrio paracholerae]TXX48293.1 cytochrome b [Vibrio cholerae]WOQ99299.1 cytochrome b [Vibrio paracholerae]